MKIYDKGLVYVKNLLRSFKKKNVNSKLPLKGYTPSLTQNFFIDDLTDSDLIKINKVFDWNSFTADTKGRRFGGVAWGNKRVNPEMIPDRRIAMMNDRFSLSGKKVLEVGCFEGVHTIGLLQYTDQVVATDSRVDHVMKTIVRTAMYGHNPKVFKFNVESNDFDTKFLRADFLHHVGVLYHLRDPAKHLLGLGAYIEKGVMLDTHYCLPEQVNNKYVINDREYQYKSYIEYGGEEAFSGMYDHSKWMLLEDIVFCLNTAGFNKVEIVEERNERNGPRVLLFAEKT